MNATYQPPAQYLFDRVVVAEDGCWNWTLYIDPCGYGRASFCRPGGKRGILAHRLSYEILVGPIPQGLTIDHLCKNPRCINPDHLEAVTNRENNMRSNSPAALAARKTHCLRGHPFSGANLFYCQGARHCRACSAMRGRATAQRKRERSLEALTEGAR